MPYAVWIRTNIWVWMKKRRRSTRIDVFPCKIPTVSLNKKWWHLLTCMNPSSWKNRWIDCESWFLQQVYCPAYSCCHVVLTKDHSNILCSDSRLNESRSRICCRVHILIWSRPRFFFLANINKNIKEKNVGSKNIIQYCRVLLLDPREKSSLTKLRRRLQTSKEWGAI